MKLNKMLITVAVVGLAAATAGYAESSTCHNRAASPRASQLLDEHKGTVAAKAPKQAVTSPRTQNMPSDRIAASPRTRQVLNEKNSVVRTPSRQVASAGYQDTGADGITASPRARQQLEERPSRIVIAPVK